MVLSSTHFLNFILGSNFNFWWWSYCTLDGHDYLKDGFRIGRRVKRWVTVNKTSNELPKTTLGHLKLHRSIEHIIGVSVGQHIRVMSTNVKIYFLANEKKIWTPRPSNTVEYSSRAEGSLNETATRYINNIPWWFIRRRRHSRHRSCQIDQLLLKIAYFTCLR